MKTPAEPIQALVQTLEATHYQLQTQAIRTVDTALVVRNWLFGCHMVEFEQASADRQFTYGKALINKLSDALQEQGLTGVSPTNLRLCRGFYLAFPEIQQTLSVESSSRTVPPHNLASNLFLAQSRLLSWSHYVVLLSISDQRARRFYAVESLQNSWGIRELKRQVSSELFERLALSRNKEEVEQLSKQGLLLTEPKHMIKSPYVLEFLDLPAQPAYSEHDLESAIIKKIELFLLELGKGFLFEARQKRFTFDDDHFYVDLVFYNRLLRCYVLIDLKREKLTHQDLGQMQMYVNYFDRYIKKDHESKTIGIILCKTKNDALVELTLPEASAIYASEYQLYLPTKEQFKQKMQEIEHEVSTTSLTKEHPP